MAKISCALYFWLCCTVSTNTKTFASQTKTSILTLQKPRAFHYDTDITSCPGRDWAALGQLWLVNWPTLKGLFASLGFVPTGCLGGFGGLAGSDAGDASDESALKPPGLEAELSGVSTSLDASDRSSNLTSVSEPGDPGCGMECPDAANASM